MKFIDLNREEIKQHSILEDGYYIYTVGSPVEITTSKSNNKNEIIAKVLSEFSQQDKLMVKYEPTNKIYFSKNFIDNNTNENLASFYIDKNTCRFYVGTPTEFGNISGILAFSGYLSANNLVEEDRPILCTKRMANYLTSRIRVMSVGVRENMLYGLFYIPNVKGMKLSLRGSFDKGYSPVSYKLSKCGECCHYTIKDWFDGLTKIKEK